MSRWIQPLSFALVLLLASPDLLARRGGSLGGYSRSRSWGSSLSSSRSGSWGKSRTSPTRRSTGGAARATSRSSSQGNGSLNRSSTRSANGTKATSSSKANYYQQARRNKTVFSDRREASQAFAQRYRDNYPSRFPKQPTSRPGYIPATTTLPGGQSVPVVFNPAAGGYGYRDPLSGGFVVYSVFRDAVMLDLLMRRNNYYYGAPPPALAAASGDSGFLRLAIWLLVIFVGINVIARISQRRKS